jgi:hypothetical protein
MSTYLERRQSLLTEALVALDAPGATPDALAARPDVESEAANLATAPAHEVSDRGFELAMLAWLRDFFPADGPLGLVRTLNAEPMLVALGRASALDLTAASSIFAIRDVHALTLADMAALRVAAGSDAAVDELNGAAMNARLRLPADQRAYLRRDIAVLLPLRIETVFDETDAGWRMRLRIVPDEASIRRDPAKPTAFELDCLKSLWQEIFDGLSDADRAASPGSWLTLPDAQHPWTQLCATIPGARAAWLAATYPPTVVGDSIEITAPAPSADAGVQPPNRVSGFPPRMEIWVGFGNALIQRIDEFEVNTQALVFDVIGGKRQADDSVLEEQDRWWVSWQAAKDAGVGRELVLPDGHGPMDIRILYAIGIGEENPAEHFQAQIDSGEMGVLPLGASTNAVDGAQAASLGVAASEWFDVARRRLLCQEFGVVADPFLTLALAGADANLPAVPKPDAVEALDQILMHALWPPLWGHQLRDIWGCVDESDRLASWAQRYVRPEGPLPPIRISGQPYGLLPTSAFSAWQTSAEEGPLANFEVRLKPHLLRFRARWASIARAHGTAVGANARALLDLIGRDAVSADYAWRLFLPIELAESLLSAVGTLDPARFDDFVRLTFKPLYEVLRREADVPPGIRQAIAFGDCAPLKIPLVVPTRWPPWFYKQNPDGTFPLDDNGNPIPLMTAEEGFTQLLMILLQRGSDHALVGEMLRDVWPDSLLFRLLLQSCMLSCAAVTQMNAGLTAPILEPLVGDTMQMTELDKLSRPYSPAASHDHPAGQVRRAVVEGIERLMKALMGDSPAPNLFEQIERAMRATLDTAMYRVDPWLTAFATRRLEHLRTRGETRFRLGAYGWVEGPMLGKAGPTSGGLLHAPSHAQALTGVILRDAFITEALETPAPVDGRNLWEMNLESARIREAAELADEVRLGSHVFEALGRRLERVVADVFADVMAAPVEVLRRAFPLRAGQPDRGVVCHGPDGIAFFLDGGAPPVTAAAADQAALLTLRAEMGAPQREYIALLRSSLDAYGDLLVAEAVHQVVQRRADAAGAAMDAAAGLAAPPTLSFTETALAAEAMNSAVMGAVPYRAALTTPDSATSPARIADNSMPSALEMMIGTADQWVWEAVLEAGPKLATLADVALEPIEASLLSSGFLADLFRHRLGVADDVPLTGSGSVFHRQAHALVKAFGNKPLLLRDVVKDNESPENLASTRALDAAALAELRARYVVLRQAAQAMLDELAAARAANDAAALEQALYRAMRWGITTTTTRAEQSAMFAAVFDHVAPSDAALLPRLANDAQQALAARLKAAPPVDTSEPLGRCIAELAAPEGQLAILSRCQVTDLTAKSGVDVNADDRTLDDDWLSVTAAVRPSLARLEAMQLEASTPLLGAAAGLRPLHAWTNSRGDHWQTAALAALHAQRAAPGGDDFRLRLPRFVAAYTCGAAWQGQDVALALIDSWTEAAPRTQQTTTAAFGFNAPAASAPQAILLAVPPNLDEDGGVRLDTDVLIDILEETRELAHARAVNAEELGSDLAVVPTTMLHATGPTGIRLEP